jgi:hypothetical protein
VLQTDTQVLHRRFRIWWLLSNETRKKLGTNPCPGVTSSTTNLAWNHRVSNPRLCGEKKAHSCLTYGTACRIMNDEDTGIREETPMTGILLRVSEHNCEIIINELGPCPRSEPSTRWIRSRPEGKLLNGVRVVFVERLQLLTTENLINGASADLYREDYQSAFGKRKLEFHESGSVSPSRPLAFPRNLTYSGRHIETQQTRRVPWNNSFALKSSPCLLVKYCCLLGCDVM